MSLTMVTIKCYSERGLCVKGITADQAQAILGHLGRAVTQLNPMMGGYVFSRKREGQIRAYVAKLQATGADTAGAGENAVDRVPCASVSIPADDAMPFPLA